MIEKTELIEKLKELRNICKNMKNPDLGGYDCDVCPIKTACFKHVSGDRDSDCGALEEFCNDAIVDLIGKPSECPYRSFYININLPTPYICSIDIGEHHYPPCEHDRCPLKLSQGWDFKYE